MNHFPRFVHPIKFHQSKGQLIGISGGKKCICFIFELIANVIPIGEFIMSYGQIILNKSTGYSLGSTITVIILIYQMISQNILFICCIVLNFRSKLILENKIYNIKYFEIIKF